MAKKPTTPLGRIYATFGSYCDALTHQCPTHTECIFPPGQFQGGSRPFFPSLSPSSLSPSP